jgi:hypothetical protein
MSTYPSINDREFDLLKKIATNTAELADTDAGDVSSIAGTAGQITASAATGDVVLSIPAGSNGQVMTTTAGVAGWAASPTGTLPSQTSNSGKLLTTDGTNASWTTTGIQTSLTAPAATDLTLSGGSSGASLVLQTGGTGSATITAAGSNRGISLIATGTGQIVGASNSGSGSFRSANISLANYWDFGRDSASTGDFVFSNTGVNVARFTNAGNLVIGVLSTVQLSPLAIYNGGGVAAANMFSMGDASRATMFQHSHSGGGTATVDVGYYASSTMTPVLRILSSATAANNSVSVLSTTEATTSAGVGALTTAGGIHAAKRIVSDSTEASVGSTTGSGIFAGGIYAGAASVIIGQTSFGPAFTPLAWGTSSIDVNGASGGLVGLYYAGTAKGYAAAESAGVILQAQSNGTVKINTGGSGAVTLGNATGGVSVPGAATFAGAVSSGTTSSSGTQFDASATGASSSSGGAFIRVGARDGAALASGDRLGGILFNGSTGAATDENSVAIFGYANDTWSAGVAPGRLDIDIAPAGSATRVNQFRLTPTTATFAGAVTQSTAQSWGVVSTATAAGTTTLVSTSKVVQVFTGSTTQTVQLPAANLSGAGLAVMYVVKNRSSGTVTLARAGADTIDGATTLAITTGNAAMIASNGVDTWHVI